LPCVRFINVETSFGKYFKKEIKLFVTHFIPKLVRLSNLTQQTLYVVTNSSSVKVGKRLKNNFGKNNQYPL